MLLSQKCSGRVATGKEHTRHNWCAWSSFSDLQIVDTSCLVGYLPLLVYLSRALYLRRLWCRVELSWLATLMGEVFFSPTIETRFPDFLSLRWSGCSGIPLLLRGLIILRSLNVLLQNRSNHHLLLPLLLIGRPGRRLICKSRALGSTFRRTSC